MKKDNKGGVQWYLFENISRTSNIAFLTDLAETVDLDFGLIQWEYFLQKGFIPLLGVPSFFEKLQGVMKFLCL